MPRKSRKQVWHCIQCGAPAEVKYCREWFCGVCLNPDPTPEYLKREREHMNGQWGGVNIEAWNVV